MLKLVIARESTAFENRKVGGERGRGTKERQAKAFHIYIYIYIFNNVYIEKRKIDHQDNPYLAATKISPSQVFLCACTNKIISISELSPFHHSK